jgi:hypothetical protein
MATLYPGEKIKSGIVDKISEINVPPLPLRALKILVDERESRACAEIGRPSLAACGYRQPVDRLQIQSNKIGNLTEGKLRIGTKEDVSIDDGSDLGMHAKHE